MRSEFRHIDHKIEQEIAHFLDKHFYTKRCFTSAVRTYDKENQIMGSDIVVSVPYYNIKDGIVDEKAATRYVNKNLGTFSLELSMINANDEIIDGWLLDDKNKTEYYLLQWLKADVEDWRDVRESNIREIEFCFVKKKDILEYLRSQGYDRKKLQEAAFGIRMGEKDSRLDARDRDWYLHYSSNIIPE